MDMFEPITIARNLRKRLTDTERFLWSQLRARQIEGCKFRRQTPIGKYIVDFVCHEQRVIVAIPSHKGRGSILNELVK